MSNFDIKNLLLDIEIVYSYRTECPICGYDNENLVHFCPKCGEDLKIGEQIRVCGDSQPIESQYTKHMETAKEIRSLLDNI